MTVSTHLGDSAPIRAGGPGCPTRASGPVVVKGQSHTEATVPVRTAPAPDVVSSAGARRGRPRRTGAQMTIAEFKRLWLDPDVPAQAIADRLGVTVQAVRFRAISRRLPLRKGGGGRNRKVDPALFREMWDANVGVKAIAAFFDVHQGTIVKRSQEWEFPARVCNRWNSISIMGFLLGRAAKIEQAALRNAEMIDHNRRAPQVAA